jgi:hypothetical protein
MRASNEFYSYDQVEYVHEKIKTGISYLKCEKRNGNV